MTCILLWVVPANGIAEVAWVAALLQNDDQGVPWLVFPNLGEQCPISQQVQAQ